MRQQSFRTLATSEVCGNIFWMPSPVAILTALAFAIGVHEHTPQVNPPTRLHKAHKTTMQLEPCCAN